MKALRFSGFGDVSAVLHIEEVSTPTHASINLNDVKNVQGKMKQTTLPRTPGRDLPGIIVAGDKEILGKQIWAAGGDIGFTRDGSHAEFIAIPRRGIRPKPKSLSMVEAASVGIKN